MNVVSIIFVLVVAFLAGLEGVLDEWQFHQPIVACTLIGIVTGHPMEGVLLGGTLQMVALGWMNIGAAVAPDAALASVASAILVCMKGASVADGVASAMALAVAGLVLTIFIRTITVGIIHLADAAADQGNLARVNRLHLSALTLQGLRILIPAAFVIAVPAEAVQAALEVIPAWISGGLAAAGGFIVVVGYAMVINMMATKELWPFFFIGFVLSVLSGITLIGMGILGVCLAFIYINLKPEFNGGGGSSRGDSVDDQLDMIMNDYE
ncbi:PTS mannose/fructose/sorbose transporter subunit IIC [Olsenella sp. HMSC062G07]|uniref:PTS mannose/fructose/sorbose transporter subunit IIC n=1 Tax=Olsenella sp. HMSC062G07 TaxID=1739330 RepID=UPI0008A5161A|nr:PTS mannose/fructose/sorbose transporter subunit IIC [Olsenella sp. HMSC062G07]OFK23687.1 PTS mannose/fructose/sorbose transporter subunit IIC [Olsenella sp. HMSC062G07]